MKKYINFSLLALLAGSLFFNSCGSDDPQPIQQSEDKYVLITLSDRVTGNKAGFISAFDAFPTGTISNSTSGSLEGQGMGGWRIYGNWIFKMFTTIGNLQGIERINVAKDGTVTAGAYISSKNPSAAATYNGTGNLVIQDDNLGFYWDAAEPLKIQKFNPTTMKNIGALDFSAAVNAVAGSDNAAITFKSIGQKFLAIKGGKLFANMTFAKNPTTQIGFFDDFFPDVYIAVIDIATGAHEKTIKIEDTGSIAYINENHMYDFDTNGDLYIVTQGTSIQALGGKSKIARIKANETDIDQTWELKFSDFRAADDGKFVGVFAKNGKLIVTLNTIPLTSGPTGNINSADIWKFYSIDVADVNANTPSSAFKEITGIPVGTNPGAAMAATEVDGKILLRGATLNSGNGYYEYNPANNSATKLFEVNVGGAVSGFTKITVN